MNRTTRIAQRILATLPETVAERLSDQYGVPVETIRYWEKFTESFGKKADLLTEWMVRYEAQTGRATQEMNEMDIAFSFYLKNSATPEFQKTVKRLFPDKNPKNILDYTPKEISTVEDEIVNGRPDSGKPAPLHQGAALFYEGDGIQIIKIATQEAACQYGRGTKFCTSNAATAEGYLKAGPLYMIYRNGKKTAQLYIGRNDNIQLMNLQNNPLKPDQEIVSALRESSLLDDIVRRFLSMPEDHWKKYIDNWGIEKDMADLAKKSPVKAYYFAHYVLKGRFPEGERSIVQNPQIAVAYAANIVKGPWPEGEKALADDTDFAVPYATDTLRKRFPAAEPYIETNPQAWQLYRKMMKLRGDPVPE